MSDPSMPPAASEAAPSPLPWEDAGQPLLARWLATVRLFVLEPREAYRRMPLSSALGLPILYGVLLGWLGALVQFLWSLLFQGSLLALIGSLEGMEKVVPAMALGTLGGLVAVALTPVVVLIVIFVWSAIVHLFLMVAGGANHGFAVTLRVVCYAYTSQVAQLLPVFGDMVALLWGLALSVLGLAQAHGTAMGRALAAILLPLALCCICAAALLLVVLVAVLGVGH